MSDMETTGATRSQDKEKNKQEQNEPSRAEDCPSPEDVPPSWITWSVKLVSLALVLGLLGFMTYKAVSDDRPPTFGFEVKTKDVRLVGDRFATPIKVTNQGTSGVSRLVFEAQQSGEPMTLEMLVLGPGQTQLLTVWLPEDPRTKPPEFTVISFVN